MGVVKDSNAGNGAALRGINLFAVVLDELVSSVGEGVSTDELMKAAQYLIELSKNDYVVETQSKGTNRPNYYSHDVLYAITEKRTQIMCFEKSPVDIFDPDEISSESIETLRRISLGSDELKWEF